MLKAALALALMFLLACSAQAGTMQNDAPAPPPSQPAIAPQEPANITEEPNANVYLQDEVPGDMVQFALEVFAVLPSLF